MLTSVNINDNNYGLYMLVLFVLGTLITILKGKQATNCSGLFRATKTVTHVGLGSKITRVAGLA
jgi:hypothetical protein